MSSLPRTLRSWVRIPLKAWLFGLCMRFFCVCVVLCLGGGLATAWSLVQRVLPSVKNGYGTEYEIRVLKGLEVPLKKIWSWSLFKTVSFSKWTEEQILIWISGPHSENGARTSHARNNDANYSRTTLEKFIDCYSRFRIYRLHLFESIFPYLSWKGWAHVGVCRFEIS
jgi:hypothetical protein